MGLKKGEREGSLPVGMVFERKSSEGAHTHFRGPQGPDTDRLVRVTTAQPAWSSRTRIA